MDKKIVLSGIRPTGQLHLGNYLGALSNFVKMQNEGNYDSYYFIADLHALTTNPDPKELHTNVRHILAEYLAAGLDPEKSTIFVQSDIPEVSEMYLLLNMHVGIFLYLKFLKDANVLHVKYKCLGKKKSKSFIFSK